MKSRMIAAACALALVAGCSGQPQNGMGNAQNAMPADNTAAALPAAPALPTGETGFRQLAECSATVEALARLYDAIASGEQGSRQQDMMRTAAARRSAALTFETNAMTAGLSLNHSRADLDRIKRERHAALERERARQPDFGEFAIWLGREADRCAALDPTAG